MTVSGMNSSQAGTLFSSLSGGGGLYSSLGDYGSIKSGSYGKLLNAYYKDMGSNNSIQSSSSKVDSNKYSAATDRTSRGYREAYLKAQEEKANKTDKNQSYINKTQSEAKKNSSTIASESNAAVNALDTLSNSDTYKKNSAGNYNTDEILKNVQSYVDSYNNMISKAADSKVSGVTSQVSALQSATTRYSKELSNIGITAGSDGKLSINTETFKNSDMSAVKDVFGRGNYGYTARTNAYMTGYYAKQDMNSQSTYGSNGAFSMSDFMSTFQTSM